MTIGLREPTATRAAVTGACIPARAPAANSRSARAAMRRTASGRRAATAAAATASAAASSNRRLRVIGVRRAGARAGGVGLGGGSGYPGAAPAVRTPEIDERDDRGDPPAPEDRQQDLERRPGEVGDGHRDVQVGPDELRAPENENPARLDQV